MAGFELTDLTEDTSPSSSDIAYSVKDPTGTPLDRKVTWLNALKGAVLGLLTSDSDMLVRLGGVASRLAIGANKFPARSSAGALAAKDITDFALTLLDDSDATTARTTLGTIGWTLVVNESGASIANWTSVAGTWSADAGGYIKQTDATATYRGLRLTAGVHPGAGLVGQAEVRFPTSATTDRRAMLGLAGAAAVASTRDPWSGIGENTDLAWIQLGDVATANVAMTVNEDVWYTIRVAVVGNVVSLWVDGTFQNSRRLTAAASTITDASQFMLVNYTGEAHFRNIKVWRLDAPT